MEPSIRQDFALGVCLDNGLLLASAQAGEPIPPAEILSLAAATEAVYLTATLESRRMERTQYCLELWSEAARSFKTLCEAWAGIDSDNPNINWLRRHLEHFRGLALDRCELYNITSIDRRRHTETRGDACFEYSFSQRHDLEQRGETDHSSPAHIYSIGHL